MGLLSLIGIVAALLACGSDDQFTNKLVAQPFVSKLFGQTTKTIALSTNEGDQIAWMGLEWSGDFKFFQIESVNNLPDIPETIDSTAVVENITVSSNPFDKKKNGELISGPLTLRITYKPVTAIESELKPHKAYLLIAYEKPNLGIVRIELQGFTKGVNVSKCARNVASMKLVEYKVVDDVFDLYLCDSNANIPSNLVNSDKGEKTNKAPVPISGTFTFYKPDNETVCFVGSDKPVDKGGKPDPTIPDFDLPIPEGLAPVKSLKVNQQRSSFAECSLDKSGNLLCDANVLLEVGGTTLPIVPVTVSNIKEKPISRDCQTFGEIPDLDDLPDDNAFDNSSGELTIVAWGEIGANPNTTNTAYNIDGGLVVAVIKLIK